MKYRVTERQLVDYTWVVDTDDLDDDDDLDELLAAVNGVPSDAASKLIESETTYEVIEDDGTWTCPGCSAGVEPSDVRRHASECDKYDGSQGY